MAPRTTHQLQATAVPFTPSPTPNNAPKPAIPRAPPVQITRGNSLPGPPSPGPLLFGMKGGRRFSVDNIYARTPADEDPPILLARRGSAQEPVQRASITSVVSAPQPDVDDGTLSEALQMANRRRRHTVDQIPIVVKDGKMWPLESRLSQQRGSTSSDRSVSTLGSAHHLPVEMQALWDLQIHSSRRSKKFSDAGPETPNTVTSEAFTLAESFEFGAPYPYAEDEKDVFEEELSTQNPSEAIESAQAREELFQALSFSLNLLDDPSVGLDLPDNVMQELKAAAH